jgi:uncharacterized protein YukE
MAVKNYNPAAFAAADSEFKAALTSLESGMDTMQRLAKSNPEILDSSAGAALQTKHNQAVQQHNQLQSASTDFKTKVQQALVRIQEADARGAGRFS